MQVSSKRAELRRKRRQPFRYSANILIDQNSNTRSCSISDISDSGARLLIDDEGDLPDQFSLLLNTSGQVRRVCRVVWRDGKALGVKFLRSPDQDQRVP